MGYRLKVLLNRNRFSFGNIESEFHNYGFKDSLRWAFSLILAHCFVGQAHAQLSPVAPAQSEEPSQEAPSSGMVEPVLASPELDAAALQKALAHESRLDLLLETARIAAGLPAGDPVFGARSAAMGRLVERLKNCEVSSSSGGSQPLFATEERSFPAVNIGGANCPISYQTLLESGSAQRSFIAIYETRDADAQKAIGFKYYSFIHDGAVGIETEKSSDLWGVEVQVRSFPSLRVLDRVPLTQISPSMSEFTGAQFEKRVDYSVRLSDRESHFSFGAIAALKSGQIDFRGFYGAVPKPTGADLFIEQSDFMSQMELFPVVLKDWLGAAPLNRFSYLFSRLLQLVPSGQP